MVRARLLYRHERLAAAVAVTVAKHPRVTTPPEKTGQVNRVLLYNPSLMLTRGGNQRKGTLEK